MLLVSAFHWNSKSSSRGSTGGETDVVQMDLSEATIGLNSQSMAEEVANVNSSNAVTSPVECDRANAASAASNSLGKRTKKKTFLICFYYCN